jgi:hypothetical protein
MAEPNGNTRLDTYVVGTRSDLAPTPLPSTVFTHRCGHCKAKTLTETEYPIHIQVICNVCASEINKQIGEDSPTKLLYTMSDDLKARLIDIASRQRLPVEEVFRNYLAWKLDRPTKAAISSKPEKKTKG